jgi:hypothetical protein
MGALEPFAVPALPVEHETKQKNGLVRCYRPGLHTTIPGAWVLTHLGRP